ncbi:MAG: rhodanese-like domain-containing protein, partial [Pirellulaceae bacterium]|nr:rhodanese-like domain-containing protein [Pirellulaceae bacterium]
RDEFEANRDKYAGRTVIPYCAVGGRCSTYAAKLADQGLQVKNYKGSMLDWVISELPLVTPDGTPTDRVFAFGPNHKIPGKYKQVRK